MAWGPRRKDLVGSVWVLAGTGAFGPAPHPGQLLLLWGRWVLLSSAFETISFLVCSLFVRAGLAPPTPTSGAGARTPPPPTCSGLGLPGRGAGWGCTTPSPQSGPASPRVGDTEDRGSLAPCPGWEPGGRGCGTGAAWGPCDSMSILVLAGGVQGGASGSAPHPVSWTRPCIRQEIEEVESSGKWRGWDSWVPSVALAWEQESGELHCRGAGARTPGFPPGLGSQGEGGPVVSAALTSG